MRVNLVKKNGNELKIELEGEGHTFCNLFQHVLLEDREVEIAGYDLPHPLIPSPILYVRTKEKKVEKVLEKALDRVSEMAEEFRDKFQEAVKKG